MSTSTYMISVKQLSPTKLDDSPHVPSPAITAASWSSPFKIKLTLNSHAPMRNSSFDSRIVPEKHILDNKISTAMKDFIQDKYKMIYKKVPPRCHRRNAAEFAIRNFKVHFLSILAGVADDFPLTLWDKLLPQAEITINLLWRSNATPTISTYPHLNGPFDYNKMPLAPRGCNVQANKKSDSRGTWAFQLVDGWYLNTSPKHYQMHKCHIKHTNSECFSDTIKLKYKRITILPSHLQTK
ncbi:LOW QUALITY PROTEIN: hypothetical protein ACHAW6_000939 [Cyclotella cf. meneghiniana]